MLEPGRWALSPAYDINPIPETDRARMNKMAITEDSHELSIAGAIAAASRFGLQTIQAKKILNDVVEAVSSWRKIGRKLHLRAATLDAYASAFEHPLMDEAEYLCKKG